jgi:hypothetical protein
LSLHEAALVDQGRDAGAAPSEEQGLTRARVETLSGASEKKRYPTLLPASLGERSRQSESLQWEIGGWWNTGEPCGDQVEIVRAADWTGPAYQTCRNTAVVAAKFPVYSRSTSLTFKHHQIVSTLETKQARSLLNWCARTDPPRSTSELKTGPSLGELVGDCQPHRALSAPESPLAMTSCLGSSHSHSDANTLATTAQDGA